MRPRALDCLNRPSRLAAYLAICLSSGLASSKLRAAEAERDAPPRPEPRVGSPWPEIAAVFPGVIVHGSGTFLQNRTQTTERLLLLEGAGLLTALLSGLVLFQTGAARDVVGPTALVGVAGAGTLGLSFLSSVYATWAPNDGFGEARRQLPLVDARLGYLHVYDPQFDYRHFATTRVDGRLGSWHLGAGTAHAPLRDNQRYQLAVGYRLLGPVAGQELASEGSYLEPTLGYSEHHFDPDGFTSRVLELAIDGRLDTERYLPDVRGAFFQLQAGLAKQWLAFDLPGVDTTTGTTLLLAHVGFGIYLGHRHGSLSTARGGEVEIYYDHRHDGLIGGLKMNGLGSGPVGHFGARVVHDVTDLLGVYAQTEIGSAWGLGLGLTIQAEAL